MKKTINRMIAMLMAAVMLLSINLSAVSEGNMAGNYEDGVMTVEITEEAKAVGILVIGENYVTVDDGESQIESRDLMPNPNNPEHVDILNVTAEAVNSTDNSAAVTIGQHGKTDIEVTIQEGVSVSSQNSDVIAIETRKNGDAGKDISVAVGGGVSANSSGTHEFTVSEWDSETEQYIPVSTKEVGNSATGITVSTDIEDTTININSDVEANSEQGKSTGVSATINQYNQTADASVQIDIGGDVSSSGKTGATGITAATSEWHDLASENAEAPDRSITISVEGNVTANSQGDTIGVSSLNFAKDAEIEIFTGSGVTATAYGTREETYSVWDEATDSTVSVTRTVGNNATGASIATNTGKATLIIANGVEAISEQGSSTGIFDSIQQMQDSEANATIDITVGGDVTASGKTGAMGIDARMNKLISGDIEASEQNTKSTISVNGNVIAESEGDTRGIHVNNTNSEFEITVDGNVIANGGEETKGILAVGSSTITVNGGVLVTASGTHEETDYEWDPETEESVPVGTYDVGNAAMGIEARLADSGNTRIKINNGVNVTSEQGFSTGLDAEILHNSESQLESSMEIEVDGDVNVTGKTDVTGLNVNTMGCSSEEAKNTALGNNNITIAVNGNIITESENHTTGVYALGDLENANISITVDGDVSATGTLLSSGIIANANDGSNIDINVNGDVTSIGENGYGLAVYASDDSTASLNIGGSITSDGTGILVSNWNEEEIGNGARIEIKVAEDVTGGNKGLEISGSESEQTNIIIAGTLKGEKDAVVINSEETAENVSLTVWKIEPDQDGNVATVLGDWPVDEATGQPIRDYEKGRPRDEAASEAFAKTINYIIKLKESEGADLSVDGATTTEDGLYTAHEDDTVTLKVTVKPGYELVNAFNNDMKIERAADGNYYVTVPRGGGVLLSVRTAAIALPVYEEYEAPITIQTVSKKKKGSAAMTEKEREKAILSSEISVSAETDSEGVTDWALELNVPACGFSDGLVITADMPEANGIVDSLATIPEAEGLLQGEMFFMEEKGNQLVFSFYKDADHTQPGLNAKSRKIVLHIKTKAAENWPEGIPHGLTISATMKDHEKEYTFQATLCNLDKPVKSKWQKITNESSKAENAA